MKQTIITLVCLLAFTGTQAQIEKGSIALGMNAGAGYSLTTDKTQTSNTIRLNVQPVFEYFIANNLSLGASVNGSFQFNNSRYTDLIYPSTSNNYLQNYSLGIQLKKYWFMSPKIGFTASPQLASTYYESNNRSEYGNNITSTSNTYYWYHSAGLNIGALYFIKPNLAIEAQTNFINYSYYPANGTISNERHSFSVLAFQNSLTVGIKYILGNKASLTP